MGRDLIWFGPAASVTAEVRAQITRLKPDIISLLQESYPSSTRAWGVPLPADWREHPGSTLDAEEDGP